jgi:hypothetical protein
LWIWPCLEFGTDSVGCRCEVTILPNPGGGAGAGEGGYGFFSHKFTFIDHDGVNVTPDACEYTDTGHYCVNCIFNSKYLSSPANATGVSTSYFLFPFALKFSTDQLPTVL